jgi:hypothetical protein
MEAATASRRPAAAAPARVPRDRPKPKAVPRSRPKAVPHSQTKPARAPRKRQAPARRPGAQLTPIALGTATAVRGLPDSGLVVRMTRGRIWIGVLGVLLAGIVGLNVVTLSFAASSGKFDEEIATLEAENSMLNGKVATRYGPDRIRNEAAELGLGMSTELGPQVLTYSPADVGVAAARLSGAG